ncbi:hypothetical protein CNAG_07357 [Cryptococcus neoformans var. grubii H99]|uniref:Transposase n=1 Tax=Cryptococcus neoformans (strain H99 / ATCC 208821 / CBS 10515 / FGSC 9487) TaxID=235443 RepID=J9VGP5_CRYN9|nr:hypothetical protein CNAG_07357 [Cryptococcus neoformans var. grubii H99]AFR92511.1 hypothetical protein CNAG_07357 [Cryptococcus neoformans var. grubii H99]AUB21947.1 hypothetical protein CKF44_07357 [Cryptococcus neoformans var. grubii]|eukprot:XP_012047052.1 hypothetical protein CNAG_07357 [Cryptococcus neoformans var. grubii H99]
MLDQGQVRNLLRDFIRSPREPWSVHAKRYNVGVTTIVRIAHEHGFYRRIMRPGGREYEAAKDYPARRRSVRPTTHPTNLPFWSTEPDGLGSD